MFRIVQLLGILFLLLEAHVVVGENRVIWHNHCDYDLYFWIVGKGTFERDDFHTRVPARSQFVDDMKEFWSGTAIKIRDLPYYTVAPAGILQLEYFLDYGQNKIFYDSSIINCDINAGPQSPSYCPFVHGGVSLFIPQKREPLFGCRDAYCRLGGKCNETYLRPGGWVGEPSLSCGLGIDIVFETCVEMSAERTWENGKPGHLIPPVPAPAPWLPPPPVSSIHTATQSTSSFDVVTKTVTQPPIRTGYPVTYPPPHDSLDNDMVVCFDSGCMCYATYGETEGGPANCIGMEGVMECHFAGDCETWYLRGQEKVEANILRAVGRL